MIVLYIFGTIILLMAVCRPFTIFFHELGHAIPALIFGSDKVTMYIGSYGETKHSWTFKLGRLIVFFMYNPLRWTKGLCHFSKKPKITVNQNIMITFCGPVMSLIVGCIWIYIAFNMDVHGSIKLLSAAFILSGAIDLVTNLTPNDQPIILHDGETVYNDGQQLFALLKYRTYPAPFFAAAKLYNEKEYAQAALQFRDIIYSGVHNIDIYRLAITSYLMAKEYKAPLPLCEEFEKRYKLKADDYTNIGLMHSISDNREIGLRYYQKALKLKPKHLVGLNNRGYEYNMQGLYDRAIRDFNKAIKIDPSFAFSYNNRGLAKIKLGHAEEGLADIQKSIELDPNNAYTYRNIGIYHFDLGEFSAALPYFEKSFNMDPSTHLLKDYLERTEKHLKSLDK